MKTIKIIAIAFVGLLLFGCGSSNTEEKKESFEELANEQEFREKHDEPRADADTDHSGSMTELSIEGAPSANAYVHMNEESNIYLLLFHEWWGLNDYIKTEADAWHEKLNGANVIALDLYDGKVATERDSAQKYMQSANQDRIYQIIDAALASIPENARIGTIGWCFGGGWSLKGSITAGERAEACVMYYGMPVTEVNELKKLEADVLFIYGTKDKWINEEVANQFAENMKVTDEDVIIKAFDADHAFANPTQERYNEGAAAEANAIALEFLRNELLSDDDLEEEKDLDENED